MTDELFENYPWPDRKYVRCNLVMAIDGGVTYDGSSAGLSGPADKALLHHLRSTADVVLVGSRTASADDYIGVFPPGYGPAFPNRHDGTPAPALAVLSRSGTVGEPNRYLTKTLVHNYFVLTSDSPDALAAAETTVARSEGTMTLVHAPEGLPQAIDLLHDLGFTRILCEGGPQLFTELTQAGLVDEYCIAMSPHLGGTPRPPGASPHAVGPRRFRPVYSQVVDEFVFSRWTASSNDVDGREHE